jgi:HK97 family phage major capsid protein/HK97 family phage prohead protease
MRKASKGLCATRSANGGDVISRFMVETIRREFRVQSLDKDKRTVELAFSSDVELERWPGIAEKLSHASGACDLSRLNAGANLLFNHDRDEYLGVVESARIDADGFGRAVVRFGKSEDAEEIWQDVQDGILRNVSVGYRIMEVKLAEERENGPDVYLVTSWQPYEISIVTIPADTSVGVGRSADNPQKKTQPNAAKKILMNREQMIALLKQRGLTVADDVSDVDLVRMVTESEPKPVTKPTISVESERKAGRVSEQERVKAIIEAGKKYRMNDIALDAVQSGKTVEETRELFLDELNKRNQTIADASKPVGLTDKEARSFSFVKLIRALSSEPSDRSAREAAKFELEACSAAAEKVTHRTLKGTMIPVDVLVTPMQERSNTVSIAAGAGYTGTGGNTVQTQLLAASFIDILRNRTVLMGLGTELGGLVGNIDIPKQTSGTAGYWIGEDADASKDDIDFGLVSLRPKTVANYGEITRRMLMQPSLAVEALLRNDLARGLALTIDLAGFYGDGTGNAPVGIKSTDGINGVDFGSAGAPTFAELVAMETAIALDNADVASMAYVANASFRGYAKTARKISTSTDSQTIWEPGNTVNGYKTEITNQITAGDVFFGNFADFLIGLWGGLEITVDPYTHSTKGRLRIVTMQDVDFAVRRAASFCYGVKP